MASIAEVGLTIAPAPTERWRVTLAYVVSFDGFDTASDQPYRERVDLVGHDAGEPSQDATRHLWEQVLGRVQSSMGREGVLARNHSFDVPSAALTGGTPPVHVDEIVARVTLAPMPAQVVGPIDSAPFELGPG